MPKQSKLKGGHKGKRSAKHKASGKYARQFDRTIINKHRRHKNHIRVHPGDIQSIRAMEKVI